MRRVVIGAVIVAVGCSLAYLEKRCSPNRDDAKLSEIRQLYSTLPVPPGLKERGSSFQSKADGALVETYFDSSSAYEEVKAFYLRELINRGWKMSSESPMKDWGRDFGGRRLEFRRAEYSLVIQYAGERDDQWDYAVTLLWKNT